MKFTDGFWRVRDGITPLFAEQAHDVWAEGATLKVYAPTRVIRSRGDTLNRPVLTVTLSSPLEGVRGPAAQRRAHRDGDQGRHLVAVLRRG
ncbi:MAG TPA: hypothetical protein VF661_16395 [Actinomycetales bacterium]|jgi:alpha-D-xyloside xylohydrolase